MVTNQQKKKTFKTLKTLKLVIDAAADPHIHTLPPSATWRSTTNLQQFHPFQISHNNGPNQKPQPPMNGLQTVPLNIPHFSFVSHKMVDPHNSGATSYNNKIVLPKEQQTIFLSRYRKNYLPSLMPLTQLSHSLTTKLLSQSSVVLAGRVPDACANILVSWYI